MGACTPATVLKQIASGKLAPVYLVLGDDEHEKAELAAEFEHVIEEGLRAFNVDRFYGGETSLGAILDAARTFPMMAPRRVVITLRAERAIQPKRESEAATRDAEAFTAFIESPPSHVTLVLISAALDERRRLTKRLLAHATVVRCGQLETVSDAQRWIRARMKAADKRMADDAIRLMSERVGPDTRRLRDEVDRLLLFCANAEEISVSDVRDVAGPAAAYDNWAVTRAIERGATPVALRELGLALERGAVPYMVLGQLAWVARARLPPQRIPGAVDAVFRTDLALKRSSGDPRILLERLVVDLCGTPGERAGSRRR